MTLTIDGNCLAPRPCPIVSPLAQLPSRSCATITAWTQTSASDQKRCQEPLLEKYNVSGIIV